MKKRDIIGKSFERLRGYCLKQKDCTFCRFNKDDECVLYKQGIPATWRTPKEMAQEGETDG